MGIKYLLFNSDSQNLDVRAQLEQIFTDSMEESVIAIYAEWISRLSGIAADEVQRDLKEYKSTLDDINELRENNKPEILQYIDKVKSILPDADYAFLQTIKEQMVSQNIEFYYNKLREYKGRNQMIWLKYFMAITAGEFEAAYVKAGGGNDIIVCILPEFYWQDINDNNKHKTGTSYDIVGYNQPLYMDVFKHYFDDVQNNPLAALTQKYKNVIFFAGTAIYKNTDAKNRSKERFRNELCIYYYDREAQKINCCKWNKHNYSAIDGFCDRGRNVVKNKMYEAKGCHPFVKFGDVTFAYDICLDFVCGKIPAATEKILKSCALSKQYACENKGEAVKPDVNILIAGGMPVRDGNDKFKDNIKGISSSELVRCDAVNYNDEFCCEGFHLVEDKIDSYQQKIIEVEDRLFSMSLLEAGSQANE